MSKKSKRRASRAKSAPAKLSPADTERKAREDLTGGRYREAIQGFKELLKLEPLPAWRLALADAYAGRAKELAAKDMLKEALAIWENRAHLGPDVPFDSEHAALLLRLGRVESVLALFASAEGATPAQRERLRAHLAAACLAGEHGIVERLPADDPAVLHAQAARTALSAYCRGDDKTLQEALAAIPFRSPYRDWVQILKALQRLPDQPDEAAGLLARVGEDSAFRRLRQAALLALLPQDSFVTEAGGASKASLHFACALRGWTPQRIALFEEIRRLGAEPRPEVLLRLMGRHRESLGADWTRRRGLRLLISGYPASRKHLPLLGNQPASPEESVLLGAWHAERREDPWEEADCWEHYARHLIQQRSDTGGETDRKLRIALALRRCDRVHDILAHCNPSADPDDLDRVVSTQLEQSLTLDPDDRDTYLRLIGYYRRGKRLKDVRRLLTQASDRWPKDMQVLGAALDTAIDAGSFKKAACLARQMLALDGINTGVRERLVRAHLAHARKQVAKGRLDLARKELGAAEEWARGVRTRDQLDLTSALIGLIEDTETGTQIVRDMVARLGGGLAAHLDLALATEALGLSPRALFKNTGLGILSSPERDDLLATLTGLRTHLDGGGKLSVELSGFLAEGLVEAPWGTLSRSEMEAACDTLRRGRLPAAGSRAARSALKRWKGEPLFELHAFEAKYSKNQSGCSDADIDRLEEALVRAREIGDTRTALRIGDILASLNPFTLGSPPFAPPPGELPAMPDGETLGILVGALGLDMVLDAMDVPAEMKRELKKLARQQGREVAVEALATALGLFSGALSGEIEPPVPRPPGRKPASGGREQPRPQPTGKQAHEDDSIQQLDLFP